MSPLFYIYQAISRFKASRSELKPYHCAPSLSSRRSGGSQDKLQNTDVGMLLRINLIIKMAVTTLFIYCFRPALSIAFGVQIRHSTSVLDSANAGTVF